MTQPNQPNKLNPIVVLCHNNRAMTERCLKSLLSQDIPVEVLAVDNGSRDGTGHLLDSLYPRVRTVHCSPQIGVSKGWNRMLRLAFSEGASHALVVNNDTILRPDCYRLLLSTGLDFVTAASSQSLEETLEDTPDLSYRESHPDFSCFLISADCWRMIGPFDEGMFLYASDCDIHLRMEHAGLTAWKVEVPYYHEASGTIKSLSEIDRKPLMEIAERDRQFFQAKWGFRPGSQEYYAQFSGTPPTDEGAAKE